MATYYISTTGNDTTGDGSLANPWATISKAITTASSGDTIKLIGHISNVFALPQLWIDKTLSFSAVDGQPIPVLDGGGTDAGGYPRIAVGWNTGAVVSFSDIVIQNVVKASGNFGVISAGAYNSVASTLRFTRCRFNNIQHVGYENALFDSTGYSPPYGHHTLTFDSCAIWDIRNPGTDAYIFKVHNAQKPIVVNNCLIYLSSTVAANRGICGWAGGGLYVPRFKNCIIINVGSVPYFSSCQGAPDWTYSSNNCVFGFNVNYTDNGLNSDLTLANTTSDPLLVDPATGNFNLRPGTPVEGKGVML